MCFKKMSAEREQFRCSYIYFLSLHDQSPLKAIKHCKLDKSEEKGGGARDEREDSSASVFEVANANGLNDLTAGGK